MASKVLVATLACMIPCIAAAQQSGVQAQGNASAQGGASVQREGNSASAQSAAAGAASGSVSKDDKSASANSGAATNAVLSSTLDAKKAKPGDPIQAKTTEPSSAPDKTPLPKGTKLLGHVTEAKAAGKGEGESSLGFVFDRAVLKDGREIPISTTVRALAAAEGAASASRDGAMGNVGGAGSAAGGAAAGGGGLVGGVAGSAGGAVGGTLGGAGRVAGGATGSLGSTVGASGHALKGGAGAIGGLNSSGVFNAGSQGVFGLDGVSIGQSANGAGSVVTSAGKNVRLENGTRMLLSVEGSAAQTASSSTR